MFSVFDLVVAFSAEPHKVAGRRVILSLEFGKRTPREYSGTPLLWASWGPDEVSCRERCPHFRGKFIAYLGHSKVS